MEFFRRVAAHVRSQEACLLDCAPPGSYLASLGATTSCIRPAPLKGLQWRLDISNSWEQAPRLRTGAATRRMKYHIGRIQISCTPDLTTAHPDLGFRWRFRTPSFHLIHRAAEFSFGTPGKHGLSRVWLLHMSDVPLRAHCKWKRWNPASRWRLSRPRSASRAS